MNPKFSVVSDRSPDRQLSFLHRVFDDRVRQYRQSRAGSNRVADRRERQEIKRRLVGACLPPGASLSSLVLKAENANPLQSGPERVNRGARRAGHAVSVCAGRHDRWAGAGDGVRARVASLFQNDPAFRRLHHMHHG